MPNMTRQPEFLKVLRPMMRPAAVDQENRIIHGMIVAEEGPFRTADRGEFDRDSIAKIHELMAAEDKEHGGLKSRFAHPTLTSDGIGKHLGRAKNPHITTVTRDGAQRQAVRADLHLSQTAFETNPNGNLGQYILDLAESDPDAMGASLVLKTDRLMRRDRKGLPLTDEQGTELPPIWMPTELHAVDVVDTGDATRAFLAVGGLPDNDLRQVVEIFKARFEGCSRQIVRARCLNYLERLMDYCKIKDDSAEFAASLEARRQRLDRHREFVR